MAIGATGMRVLRGKFPRGANLDRYALARPLSARSYPQFRRNWAPGLPLEGGFCYNNGVVSERTHSYEVFREEDAMDEASIEGALNELVKQFGDAADPSRLKLAALARQAEANRKQLQKSINTLQELLDYLRVCIKYQAFDLEATRRENSYLRKLLEDNRREDERGGS
jgi:hypothetical protein